jgi:hypothetical protein
MNERQKALTDAECRAATLADICCTQAGRIAKLEAALGDVLDNWEPVREEFRSDSKGDRVYAQARTAWERARELLSR